MTKKLYAFDLDDTLVWHDGPSRARIRVRNENDKVVRVLETYQINSHKLKENQYYDLDEFNSSFRFARSVKPIRLVIQEYKEAIESGHKTVIITARADMDDKHEFGRALKSVGIDFIETKVYRVGNFTHLPEGKAQIISNLIDSEGYDEVFFYDDALKNLRAVRKISKNYSNVTFHIFRVIEGIPERV